MTRMDEIEIRLADIHFELIEKRYQFEALDSDIWFLLEESDALETEKTFIEEDIANGV